MFPAGDVPALASALDEVIIDLDDCEVRARAEHARQHAMRFDHLRGFDHLMYGVGAPHPVRLVQGM